MASLKFFGWAKDLAGTSESTLIVEGTVSTDAMWESLIAQYPALAPYRKSFALAVNREYADGWTVVRNEDEIAVIPPVSGG